jgi:hypothetical protein
MPPGPLDRWGGGSGAPCHHAKQGGRGAALRLSGCEPCGQVVGRAGWKELLVRSCPIQHGREEMNPLIGVRLGHPQELSLYFLAGMLFHIRQNQEKCVGDRG